MSWAPGVWLDGGALLGGARAAAKGDGRVKRHAARLKRAFIARTQAVRFYLNTVPIPPFNTFLHPPPPVLSVRCSRVLPLDLKGEVDGSSHTALSEPGLVAHRTPLRCRGVRCLLGAFAFDHDSLVHYLRRARFRKKFEVVQAVPSLDVALCGWMGVDGAESSLTAALAAQRVGFVTLCYNSTAPNGAGPVS